MGKKYNTVKGDKIVLADDERRLLDALAAVVALTPEEEELMLPSRNPVPGVDDVDCDEPDPEVLAQLDESAQRNDEDEDENISDTELVRSFLNS